MISLTPKESRLDRSERAHELFNAPVGLTSQVDMQTGPYSLECFEAEPKAWKGRAKLGMTSKMCKESRLERSERAPGLFNTPVGLTSQVDMQTGPRSRRGLEDVGAVSGQRTTV